MTDSGLCSRGIAFWPGVLGVTGFTGNTIPPEQSIAGDHWRPLQMEIDRHQQSRWNLALKACNSFINSSLTVSDITQ